MSPFADPREGRRALFALLADGEHPLELRYLVPEVERGGLDDNGWRKRWADTPERADEEAALLTARGHDVFVGLLPRFGRSGAAQRRYAPGRVLWAECDLGRASRKLLMFEPTPTAVVLSGGIDGGEPKRHGYWLLDAPLSPGDVRRHVLRLTRHLEADEASCDAARVLRVPGSRSHKTGRVARLESFTGEAHALDDVTGDLPDAPSNGAGPTRPASHWAQIATGQYVTGCGHTHPDVLSWAGWLMGRLGCREVVLELLLCWNREHCKPPKPPGEIAAIVDYIEKREASRERGLVDLAERIRACREENK